MAAPGVGNLLEDEPSGELWLQWHVQTSGMGELPGFGSGQSAPGLCVCQPLEQALCVLCIVLHGDVYCRAPTVEGEGVKGHLLSL